MISASLQFLMVQSDDFNNKENDVLTRQINKALLRLSSIECMQFQYDPAGQIFGFGEIYYLIEVSEMFFMAWKNSETNIIVVHPITRYGQDELSELGAVEAWTVLYLPQQLSQGIQFREIDNAELCNVYSRMEAQLVDEIALAPGPYCPPGDILHVA